MGSSLRTTLRNSTKLTKNFILRPKKKMAYIFLSGYPYALQDKWDRLDVFSDTIRRSARAKSELGDVLMYGLKTEKDRYYREFLSTAPNSTGFYYPRYESTVRLEHGSPHIPFLARPYFNYHTTNNASKYVTTCKKQIF